MTNFLTDKDFACDEGSIFHGFFGREGGVSEGIYGSLNCGTRTNDNIANICENRRRVAAVAGVKEENLMSLSQVHGRVCKVISEPFSPQSRPDADAFVTRIQGVALGVLTADCAPVLFSGSSPLGSVVGAAHAGWGGALKGVLESTIHEMERLGVDRVSIKACVGPCISVSSYEIRDEFMTPFIKQSPENERFFRGSNREGHSYFDLPGYCVSRIANAGVGRISLIGVDTYPEENGFFSYRRSTHAQASDYGRQISVIAIK